jgi:hypothetical protein
MPDDLEERVARAIWDAMVNDEPPSRDDLEREGFIDAARAAIAEQQAAILDALDVLGAVDQFGRPVRDVIERAIEEGL